MILEKIFSKINFINKLRTKNQYVQNINHNIVENKKKCLVCYLTSNFFYDFDKKSIFYTNIQESNQIIESLIRLNYSIDVVYCLNKNAYDEISSKKYDLIFGFGDIFRKISMVQEKAIRVLYLTENPPEFSYKMESERIHYYHKRHGKYLNITRSGRYYKNTDFLHVDHIVTLGEISLLDSAAHQIHSLNPSGFINPNYIFRDRNFDTSKKNFLWFGSNGAVHKGLDLLIDIFQNRKDLTLHICGLSDQDKKMINFKPATNIRNYGWININSDKYLELVNMCSFAILPSCSEAKATSVLTCMRHSMIPIVTRNIGFNEFEKYVYLLDNYSIEYLNIQINKISNIENFTLAQLHSDVFKFSNENFTLEKFSSNFKKIISKISEFSK